MTHQIEAESLLYNMAIFIMFFAVFHPLTGTKTLQKHLHVVEEALSFDLVGHM